MKINDIDWEEMWKETQAHANPSKPSEHSEIERYDCIAPLFKEWMTIDDYPLKVLESIHLEPEWSVLDIGCGTGAIAIPIAKTVKSVTGIDFSPKMLEIIRSDAEKQSISNLDTKYVSWDDARIGVDIEPHDAVIMSRAISRTMNLSETLKKVNQAAIQSAYVTAWGGGERRINKEIMAALGLEYHNSPDYLYVFNILAQMGIQPNVKHLMCSSRVTYHTISQALSSYQLLYHLNPEQMKVVQPVIEKNLVKCENGLLQAPDDKPVWSLIWWEKSKL
ncbi:class I SAM-dependent methyltransferase [Methanospirillum lacunae]